uniref:tetratricopeptide repeat protein n=1 Tax=uncultured Campylobacter sp. TaxID=218934 RepID=UPI0026083137
AGGVYDFAFEVYGVKQDYGKAMKFYKKGCDKGNYRSCNNLGFMYENEKGVKRDYKKAFELYTKSCDIGLSIAKALINIRQKTVIFFIISAFQIKI